jgi:hypothetical protein
VSEASEPIAVFPLAVNVPVTVAPSPKVVRPLPRKLNVGLVVVFPNETFSEPFAVFIFI